MTDVETHASTRRRRRSRKRGIVFISILGMSAAAVFTSPRWIPHVVHDEASLLAFERQQRRLHTSWGLPLPGAPDLTRFSERLAAKSMSEGAPVLVRIFKKEFELELWLFHKGIFEHFTTYPICRWSGDLGPKLAQGDNQAPEGFYFVDPGALNPNSRWYRSFNVGYPNAYDKAHGRTGSLIMVHGGCASVGCFAMTDPQMDEIWRLITAAFAAGQKRFQVQIYPFRMSEQQLARHRDDLALPFWQTLKRGYDLFELTRLPPRVAVCNGQYTFSESNSAEDGATSMISSCPLKAEKS